MSLLNYAVSAFGFAFLILLVGFGVMFLWNAYGVYIRDFMLKFQWFRKKKYLFWADIVVNCLTNDWPEEEIIKLLKNNKMQNQDIDQILLAVNARLKTNERGTSKQ